MEFTPAFGNCQAKGDILHPEIIKARLKMRGWSLRSLAKKHNRCESTFRKVIQDPSTRSGYVETCIADALGLSVDQVFEERTIPDAKIRQTHRREKMKSLLKEAGYSQQSLADELGVTKQTVCSALYHGRVKWVCEKIGEIIGIPAEQLWPDRYPEKAAS